MRSNTACLDSLGRDCFGDCGALEAELSISWVSILDFFPLVASKSPTLLSSCFSCKVFAVLTLNWVKERVPSGWIEMACPAIWSVSSCVSFSRARCDLTVSMLVILGVVNPNAMIYKRMTVFVFCRRSTDYFGCASDVSLSLRYSNVLSWGHSVDWFRIDCLFGDSHCSSGDCVLSFLCWDWFFRNSNSYWAA